MICDWQRHISHKKKSSKCEHIEESTYFILNKDEWPSLACNMSREGLAAIFALKAGETYIGMVVFVDLK